MKEIVYGCYFCSEIIEKKRGDSLLDPCAMRLISNIDKKRKDRKEQELYCHFQCLRKHGDDPDHYLDAPGFAAIGEIETEE